jgi:hypothetical protein
MVRGCPAAVVLGTMRWVVFVGRARALSRLLVAVDEAAAGCARLVLVSGEAGIGKTTLVGVAAARSGLLVGWGAVPRRGARRRSGRGRSHCAGCWLPWPRLTSRS